MLRSGDIERTRGREYAAKSGKQVAWVTGALWGGGATPWRGRHACRAFRATIREAEEVAGQCGDAVSIEMLDVADRDSVTEVAQRIIQTTVESMYWWPRREST